MSTALVAVVAASGVVIALRDNDSNQSASAGAIAPATAFPVTVPNLPVVPKGTDPIASSRRQVVVISSVEDIGRVSSLPGMDVPGMATEYLVVDDEASQKAFQEFQLSLAAPGARPTTIIDLR